jgi:hypothetical protein
MESISIILVLGLIIFTLAFIFALHHSEDCNWVTIMFCNNDNKEQFNAAYKLLLDNNIRCRTYLIPTTSIDLSIRDYMLPQNLNIEVLEVYFEDEEKAKTLLKDFNI